MQYTSTNNLTPILYLAVLAAEKVIKKYELHILIYLLCIKEKKHYDEHDKNIGI